MSETEIELPAVRGDAWKAGYPYDTKMTRKEYERLKRDLQIELLKMQAWVKETGQKVVVVFEGRDAAGKGGAIKRFTEHLNPRGATVVALEKPTEREQSAWYFQRYVTHLPSAGEIVFFDRSWYNRPASSASWATAPTVSTTNSCAPARTWSRCGSTAASG